MGNDIYLELPLSITEAALGAKVEVPTIAGRTLLTIPPGTPSGAKLRLKGKGVHPAGKSPGDQYAVVRIVPPKDLSATQKESLEELAADLSESPRANAGW
jgi:DnaJ-class molecular chaperone